MNDFSDSPDAVQDPSAEPHGVHLSIFDFSPQDLKSNQRGFISQPQKEWLAGMARGIRSCSLSSALAGIGIVLFGNGLILGLFMLKEDTRAALFSNPSYLAALAVGLVIGAALMAAGVLWTTRLGARLTEARLQIAEGEVRFEQGSSGSSGGVTHYVFVGEKRFAFSEEMNDTFAEGRRYRVYYCKSGVYEPVLSLEEVVARPA